MGNLPSLLELREGTAKAGPKLESGSRSGRDPEASGSPSLFSDAHDTTITGGSFAAIGRDSVSGTGNTVINETVTNIVNNIVNNYNDIPVAVGDTILEWLSSVNFRAIQIDNYERRTPGTRSWFTESEEFKTWVDSDGGIIWGIGIPAAGKTVLASIVIRYLQELADASTSNEVSLAFAYCRYTEPIPVREILAGLLRQLLERYPFLLPLMQPLYYRHHREKTRPTQQELLSVLQDISKVFKKNFYVLDGLDEAPDDAKFDLIKALSSIKGNFIITSRPLPLLKSMLPDAVFIDIVAHPDDIKLLVIQIIDRNPAFLALLERHGLKEEILSTVLANSRGMFLHAHLQVEALRHCLNVKQLRTELARLPEKLGDMYATTMERIEAQMRDHADLAKRILLWVVHAARSLSLEELQYAVATSPETGIFDEDLVVDENVLLSVCCGLIVAENEGKMVRLIHYTAQDALRSMLERFYPHPHDFLTRVCTARLIASGFGFLESKLETRGDIEALFEEHCFLAYSYDFLGVHARKCIAEGDAPATAHIIEFICQCESFPFHPKQFHREWEYEPLDYLRPPHIIVHYNIPQLFDEVIHSNVDHVTCGVNSKTKHGVTPLALAISNGRDECVGPLLAIRGVDVNSQDYLDETPLMKAAKIGDETIARRLLGFPGIQVNVVDTYGWNALNRAATEGHAAIVKALLQFPGIEVNYVKFGVTALALAAGHGSEDIVRQLLDSPGIEVNLTANGNTPLMFADNEAVARLLLAVPGIEVNLSNQYGETALMKAATGNKSGIVKVLLEFPGIDANMADPEGLTPLMAASRWGVVAAVDELLKHPEVDVNLVDNTGRTALIWAACEGHEEIVERLLQSPNIRADLVEENSWTALSLASREDPETIVQKLQDSSPGIEIDSIIHPEFDDATLLKIWKYDAETVARLKKSFPGITTYLIYDGSFEQMTSEGMSHLKLPFPRPDDDQAHVLNNKNYYLQVVLSKGHPGIARLLADFQES